MPSSAAADPLDERIVANAALESANDALRSLCAAHAPTFVAVERRGAALNDALGALLDRVGAAGGRVEEAGDALEGDDGDAAGGSKSVGGGGAAASSRSTSSSGSAASSLATLAERHRLRRRTLLQHSSLLELLELPALMDACVRSGLYDEALSVAGFANALERRHLLHHADADGGGGGGGGGEEEKVGGEQQQSRGGGGGNRVVQGVVDQIRNREHDLRRHLLGRLRSDVTMPQCLEIVTALRRLNGVELERKGNDLNTNGGKEIDVERIHAAMELRLMVDFFEARDVWLDSSSTSTAGGGGEKGGAAAALYGAAAGATGGGGSLAKGGGGAGAGAAGAGGDGGQSEVLLDGIERYRTRTFEIATQFLAIFRGNSPSSSSSNSNQDQSLPLLSMWTTRRITTFLTTLTHNLAHIHSTATLRDALDSTAFFATSMGRVGADFQPYLPGIFEPRVVQIIIGRWTDGVDGLREVLRVCRDAGVAGPLFSTASTSEHGSNAAAGGGEGGSDERGGGTAATAALLPPPSGLEKAASSASGPITTPPPPRLLLSLPPLARLVNAVLSGLNEVRRCLLPGTFGTLRTALNTMVLDEVRVILQGNERAVLTPGLRGEASKLREVAASMKSEFGAVVEPYLKKSLEVAFGNLDFREEEEEKKEEEEKEEEKETEETTEEEDASADSKTAAEGEGEDGVAQDDVGGGEGNIGPIPDGGGTAPTEDVAVDAEAEAQTETGLVPEAEPEAEPKPEAETETETEMIGIHGDDEACSVTPPVVAPTETGDGGEGWDEDNLGL